MKMEEMLREKLGKEIAQVGDEEIYVALLEIVQGLEKEADETKKKVYYISAEFLIGKLLSNNLINLGLYEETRKVLAENGKELSRIEEIEPEP